MKTNLLNKSIFGVILMVLPLLTSCQQQKTQVSEATPAVPKTSSPSAPVYPVKVSANHRYLVDQNNTPFLIVGDTPQGLISRLNEKEIDAFWADRQAHGFNTMGWVDVLCGGRDFITNTYATTPDGIRPFTGFLHGKEDHTEYDLSKPNEPYFVRLDHIVELAAKHNILIFIDPIETAGWLQTLRNNGLKAATAYGEYLGNRYKKYPNVAWLNGNDFHGWQKRAMTRWSEQSPKASSLSIPTTSRRWSLTRPLVPLWRIRHGQRSLQSTVLTYTDRLISRYCITTTRLQLCLSS